MTVKLEKVQESTTKIKPSKKAAGIKKVAKKVVDAGVEKAVKKVVDTGLGKLEAHAIKHLTNWHSKAGPKGSDFAKVLAKHVKKLGK